jgi:hypothetical protein
MAYRDDVSALEARLHALSAGLVERERERDEVARLLAEARARAYAESVIADIDAGGPARRRRRKMWIAAWTAIALAIAGGIGYAVVEKRGPDRLEQAFEKFDRFTDQMCECRDDACVKAVSDSMTKWSTEEAKNWQPPPKLDAEHQARAEAIAKRLITCMTHATTPPSAE